MIDFKQILEAKRAAALEAAKMPQVTQQVKPASIPIAHPTLPKSTLSEFPSQLTIGSIGAPAAQASDLGHILTKVDSLRQALVNVHPDMPKLLNDIWKLLKADPNNVTLLSDEDMGVISSGLQTQTNTRIIEHTAPKRAKKVAVSVEDV